MDLKPNIIIGEFKETKLTLESWSGFQSRQGKYGLKDKEEESDGTLKAFIYGKSVDYVKISTQEQVNALNYLLENSDEIRDILLLELLNKLPDLKKIYNDQLPDIKKIEQFREHIGLTNLHIMPEDKDNFAYTGFELGCDWDDEHGIGVMMHKKRVVEIGQADISFNHWVTTDDQKSTDSEMQELKTLNLSQQRATNNEKRTWWKIWKK